MDQEHKLVNQIDPLKSFDDVESKQVRGFELSGDKRLKYLGANQVIVTELPSDIEYIMQYTNLSRILKVFGFPERALEISLDKLLSFHEVYYRFDLKQIFIKPENSTVSPVVGQLSNAVTEYDQELGGVPEEIDFDEMLLLTGKI